MLAGARDAGDVLAWKDGVEDEMELVSGSSLSDNTFSCVALWNLLCHMVLRLKRVPVIVDYYNYSLTRGEDGPKVRRQEESSCVGSGGGGLFSLAVDFHGGAKSLASDLYSAVERRSVWGIGVCNTNKGTWRC